MASRAAHDDVKQDKKMIKNMVKPAALKKAGGGAKPQKLAAGGVAKARLGQSSMDGQQKKPSRVMEPIGKVGAPKAKKPVL